jgi:predicted small metal-binding protein
MTEAHKLDCESVSDSCRFIIQSEDEQEAVELAKNHMKQIHDQELTDDELRNEHLQTV